MSIEKMKKPFASPMGKTRQLPVLLKLIPKHEVYVEPFAGGAAVYFAKEPAPRSVLNDNDPCVAGTLQFFKRGSPELAKNLAGRAWGPDKAHWEKLKAWKPATLADRTYKHLYLIKHSYGSYNPGFRAGTPEPPQNLEKIQEYSEFMKETEVTNEDWKICVSKTDGKDTFFYLDPPYYYWDKEKEQEILKELSEALPKLKGKWLLNFSDSKTAKELFKSYTIRRFHVSRPIGGIHEPDEVEKYELAIMNYGRDELMKDFFAKPKGPWGEGFPECEAWFARKHPDWGKDRVQRYCGGIHQHQRNKAIEDPEKIDAKYVSNLDDDELEAIDHQLHQMARSGINEPILNAHIFVWREMEARHLEHDVDDALTDETRFWIQEYPSPKKSVFTLDEVWDAFPDRLELATDDVEIYLVGGLVNRGWVGPNNDIDIRVNKMELEPYIERLFRTGIKDNAIREKVSEIIWDIQGGIGNSILMYSRDGVKKEGPQFFKPTQPMKPASNREYDDEAGLYSGFLAPILSKGGSIQIQPKYDGMSFQVHVSSGNIHFYTEDSLRDRSACFKKSAKEILDIKHNAMILATEMVEFTDGKQVPREDLVKWIAARPENLDDENVVFQVHDILYLNGANLADKGYIERYRALKKSLPSLRHFKVVESWPVSSKAGFDEALTKARNYPNSEGAMLKDDESPYKVGGANPRSTQWAKIKNLKSIDTLAFEPHSVKDSPGVFNYQCYSEDTEILTESGFKFFKDVSLEDKVATLNASGELEYHKPLGKQVYYHEGEMYHWRGKSHDLLISPSHNILFADRWKPEDWKLAKIETLKKRNIRLKRSAKWNCSNPESLLLGDRLVSLDSFIDFMGWWLTEGSIRRDHKHGKEIIITQYKEENIAEIEELLTNLLGRKPRKERGNFCFKSSSIHAYLKQFGYSKDRFVPDIIKNCTPRKIRHFLRIVEKAEGSNSQITTYSKKFADDLQELVLKAGWASSIGIQRTGFSVSISKIRIDPLISKSKRTLEFYKGKIYDLTVPNHTLFVRRNGKAVWSGNCYVGPVNPAQWRESDLKEWKGSTYTRIGTSYNVKAKIPEGGVLEVRCIRVEVSESPGGRRFVTWMFPKVGIPKPNLSKPATIGYVEDLAKVGSGVHKGIIIRLAACPYSEDDVTCFLKGKIKLEKAEHPDSSVGIEKLKFPIDCKLASFYKCPYVKNYYYDLEESR